MHFYFSKSSDSASGQENGEVTALRRANARLLRKTQALQAQERELRERISTMEAQLVKKKIQQSCMPGTLLLDLCSDLFFAHIIVELDPTYPCVYPFSNRIPWARLHMCRSS